MEEKQASLLVQKLQDKADEQQRIADYNAMQYTTSDNPENKTKTLKAIEIRDVYREVIQLVHQARANRLIGDVV